MPETMELQRNGPPADEPLHAAAMLLLQAGATMCSDETPPWGRQRSLELINALLALATEHGFAQADALREKLTTGVQTRRTRLLAEVAFSAVPAPALLDVIGRSGFHTAALPQPGKVDETDDEQPG